MTNTFIPKPYQSRGIQWALDKPRCGLFLPMGAGKTATTLCVLDELIINRLEVDHCLIIGPKNVCLSTWPDEIQKWPQFQYLTYAVAIGPEKKRIAAIEEDTAITLINREMVSWLVENYANNWKWQMVVVDELSSFKSTTAKRWKDLKSVMPLTDRFIGLTGTPAPRNLADIWPQIFLMDRGQRLGKTKTAFQTNYLKPGMVVDHRVYNWVLQPDADKRIYRAIEDICMSISEEEYDTRPDLQLIDFHVDLGSDLKKYKTFRREKILELPEGEITAANAGVLCGKLSQYASGQIYGDDHEVIDLHNHKLEALLELLEAADSPVIVFYYFKHEYQKICKALEKTKLKFQTLEGPEDIRNWNAGKIDVLLLNPCAAGHGLNLQQGGHIAIWFSLPNWNLELYQQANARIYRQGQKEKCQIYHLLAKGTIDEDMMQALENKNTTQQALLDALKKED